MKFTYQKTGHGATDNLGCQLQKVLRMSNQNRFETRIRYREAQLRFISHIGSKFGLQKLRNIQDKHLKSYAAHLQSLGSSDKYIKTELSAIRFLHNMMGETKFDLSDARVFNKELGLSSTPDGRADRAWTENELSQFKNYAVERGKQDIADIFETIRSTGMRLDEIVSLKRSSVVKALKTGSLHLTNTKGGVPRTIPLNERAIKILERVITEHTWTNAFAPEQYTQNRSLHKYEKSLQNFVLNHRAKFQDLTRSTSAHNLSPKEKGALTLHGLRHAYARDHYSTLIKNGMTEYHARKAVAENLGHHRDTITKIYLSGA